MGVDYFHGVYGDPTQSGGLESAQQIEAVLRSHGVISGEATSRWSLDKENIRLLDDGDADVRNLGVCFSSTAEEQPNLVNCVFGGPDAADGGAWATFIIVSGPDYRLITEGEYGPGVRVVEPPMASGAEVAGFRPERPESLDFRAGWQHIAFGAEAFDASTGCTAPVCELDWFQPPMDPATGEPLAERPAEGFTGLWRSALLIETKPFDWLLAGGYGTYPRWVLPESGFKTDLWAALGGSAHELGYSH